MLLLPPDLVHIEYEPLARTEADIQSIYRLIIFSRDHVDDDLLDIYLQSIDDLKELLSIKNAQMEAQTEQELHSYHQHLRDALDFIVDEILHQRDFTNPSQLFELLRLISPEAHALHPNRCRETSVQVGAHICPEPRYLPSLIDTFFYNLTLIKHPVVRAVYLHHELIRIHPFRDGNGRVARMAKNWILMYHLYPPIFIKDAYEKSRYIRSLSESFHMLEREPFVFHAPTRKFFTEEIDRLSANTKLVYNTVFSLGDKRIRTL